MVAGPSTPTPTYSPSPSEYELTSTDAPWPWPAWRTAADPTLGITGTPLLLQFHASVFAHASRIKMRADMDMTTVRDIRPGYMPTAVQNEETVVGNLENAWYSLLIRLPEHRWSALRWLCQQTSVTVELLIPAFGLLEQDEQGTNPVRPTLVTRDAIGAGRELHAGLRAVDDLRRWLSLSVSDVARISGISESTIYWWADHPTSVPRPAKIDRLLGLQALMWGLVDDLGETITRQWFRTGRPSSLDRLRSDPGALQDIEKEVYDWLTRRARKRLAEAGVGRPVTDEDDARDLARLAEQERELKEPLTVEALDPDQLEPNDLG